jgi:hypothetical protein
MTALFDTQGISPYAATNTSNSSYASINLGDGTFSGNSNDMGTRLVTFQGYNLTDARALHVQFYQGLNGGGSVMYWNYRTMSSNTTYTYYSANNAYPRLTYWNLGVSPNEPINGYILINPSYDTNWQDTKPFFISHWSMTGDNGYTYITQSAGSSNTNAACQSLKFWADSGNIAVKLKSYPLAHWEN